MREELQDRLGVGVVPELGRVGGRQTADHRGQGRGLRVPLGLGQRLEAGDGRTEGLGLAVLGEEPLGGADDVERVGLALLGRVAPGGDAVAAEDHADGLRVVPLDLGDVETELEAGSAPVHPRDPVTEALLGQRLAVGGGREGDAGVGVQVVDVRRVDQAVHGRVDRRGRATTAVQAVVERRDHLVLALDARVDVDERTQPVQPEHGQARLGEGAQVTAGALHPQQLGGLGRHRVRHRALGRGVAAGVVGVAGVRAQPVRALDELGRGRLVGHVSSILPGRRPRGPPRSVPGIRWRRRPASGRREGPGSPASRRGRVVRRCRTRP